MKNCHNDHDSHLIRDWSEAHSGGGNRFFQVSTFISIATANIYHLYEVFFQKTHLLLPLMQRREFDSFSPLFFAMRKGVGGGPGFGLSYGSEISGHVFHHEMYKYPANTKNLSTLGQTSPSY